MLRLLMLLLFPVIASAQQMPSEQQMQQARQTSQRFIEQADRYAAAVRLAPKVDMRAATRDQRSMQAVLDAYTGPLANPFQQKPRDKGILVFVSFSMPMTSLKRLASDSKRLGATMVLRGLVNDANGKPSLRATAEAASKLGLTDGEGFSIDPESFGKYQVRVVPTFVRMATGSSVAGDVSLSYALGRLP